MATLSSKRIGDGTNESLTYHHEDIKEAAENTLSDLDCYLGINDSHTTEIKKILRDRFGDSFVSGDEQW